MPKLPTVFISYSHKDEVWKDRVVKHLAVLQKQGLLETWNDRNIKPGQEWLEEIEKGMAAARVAVFLVSADALASEFILHIEIPRLLERREKEGMIVFPVICTHCLWEEVPWLAKLEVCPLDGRPLETFKGKLNAELSKIAKEILGLLRNGASSGRPAKQGDPLKLTTLAPLHQLPTPPADFTGRVEDLEFLRSRLSQGETGAILSVRGMGGVGKTTLALKLAEELKPWYPDAQIYLDLKGVDPSPLTTAQAIAHVIRSLKPEARLPESETDLQNLYRELLDGKRILLLMDNAAGRTQVEPLIPPPTCLLLITSRFSFTLPGMTVRDLDELPAEDAKRLLQRIAPRIGPESDELARICGRLPLALILAGSTLAERLYLSPSEYIQRLNQGKEVFGEVDATINLSYELLAEDQRLLWRLLSVFSGTFDAAAAAATWEMTLESTKELLWEMVRCSLVEWKGKERRYKLHDLARFFATSRLTPPEKYLAQRRHAVYFLKIIRSADSKYKQGKLQSREGLALFDAEWENIQAGQSWTAEYRNKDNRIAKLCSGYPLSSIYCRSLRQHPGDRIRWHSTGLEAAKYIGNRLEEGQHLGYIGIAWESLSDFPQAIEFHAQHFDVAREIANPQEEAKALGNLGNVSIYLGDIRTAMIYYQLSQHIATEIKDRLLQANAVGNLGSAFMMLGEPLRALPLHAEHLKIACEIGDRRGIGSALGNLGFAYRSLGRPRLAFYLYSLDLEIAHEMGNRRGEGRASGGLGLCHMTLGNPFRAAEMHEQQLAIAHEIGDRREKGIALSYLGSANLACGNPKAAIRLSSKHLELSLEIGDRWGEGMARRYLGRTYMALGEPRRAIEFHNQQLTIAREIGNQWEEIRAQGGLGFAYTALGEPRIAIKYHAQQLKMSRKLCIRREESRALGGLGLACIALGKFRWAVGFHHSQLKLARKINDRRQRSIALGHLGLASIMLGKHQRALKLCETSLHMARKLKDRRTECVALYYLAIIYSKFGDFALARKNYEQQLVIAKEIGDRYIEMMGYWNLGLEAERESRPEEAINLLQACVEYEREINHKDAEKDAAYVAALRARIAAQKS